MLNLHIKHTFWSRCRMIEIISRLLYFNYKLDVKLKTSLSDMKQIITFAIIDTHQTFTELNAVLNIIQDSIKSMNNVWHAETTVLTLFHIATLEPLKRSKFKSRANIPWASAGHSWFDADNSSSIFQKHPSGRSPLRTKLFDY